MADCIDFDACVFSTAHDPLAVLDHELRVVRVSDAFSRLFRISPWSVAGAPLSTLGGGRWNVPALTRLLETTLQFGTSVKGAVVEADFGPGVNVLVVNTRRFFASTGPQILLALHDITDRDATNARCAHLSSVVHS